MQRSLSAASLWLSLILSFLLLGPVTVYSAADTPIGLWKTIDDHTGAPRGHIRISEINGEYRGTIEKGLRPEDRDNAVCDKCTDSRRGQPLKGMAILTGMKKEGAEYAGGEILDPDNGKTYRCKMILKEGGKTLDVRGYIGVSLFGRTQTWYRIE
jgi:uncharacterized protein (DUF2147 family)